MKRKLLYGFGLPFFGSIKIFFNTKKKWWYYFNKKYFFLKNQRSPLYITNNALERVKNYMHNTDNYGNIFWHCFSRYLRFIINFYMS